MRRFPFLVLATSLFVVAAASPDRAHAHEVDFSLGSTSGLSAGLQLGRQAVLHLGAEAWGSSSRSEGPDGIIYQSRFWSAGPRLSLKLYLRNMDAAFAPDASARDRIVPLLRIGGGYRFGRSHSEYAAPASYRAGVATLTGGVAVVVHPRLLIMGEAGVLFSSHRDSQGAADSYRHHASLAVSLGLTTRFGPGT